MNNSSFLNDSLPKVPGRMWEAEKEFNHTKKFSLVHLRSGNIFKIVIRKQISSTSIILNSKIDLTQSTGLRTLSTNVK